MARRSRCGHFVAGPVCQPCWKRKVRSIRTRLHAAKDRAGLCDVGCWWWEE